MARQPKIAPPWQMPELDAGDIAAIKAVARGDALPEQQQRAFDAIIKKGACVGGITFNPESERVSAFAEGKRFIGIWLLNLVGLPTQQTRTPNA